MSIFTTIKKKASLVTATNQIAKALKAEGNTADSLYKSAYEGFEQVASDNAMLAGALYNWGKGLLNQAKNKEGQEAIDLYEDAINKYSFCLLLDTYYLGAAIEGGVAYMDIARLKGAASDDDLYNRARKCFEQAGEIEKGCGAFNLACVDSMTGNNEACLAALKEAKEFGHLPDDSDVLNDPDMKNVLETPWFIEFMRSIEAEREAAAKEKEARKKAKAAAKAGTPVESESVIEEPAEAETTTAAESVEENNTDSAESDEKSE